MRVTVLAVALAGVCLVACGGSSKSSSTPAPKLSADVMPIFSKAFTSGSPPTTQHCIDCHAAGQDAPNVPFTGTAAQTYTVIQTNGLVNTANPAQSKLYTFPTGLDAAHPGGKLFESSSADAQTILGWIEAGAPND